MSLSTRRERGYEPGPVVGMPPFASLEGATSTVEAEVSVSAARVQLFQFSSPGPVMRPLRDEDSCLVVMCLTPRPRNARARYCTHWTPGRFEALGDVFVVPPGELMQAGSDSGRTTSIVCRLRLEAVRTWLGADIPWSERLLEATLDVGGPNIQCLLLRLAEEVRHPGFGGRMLIELIAGQLAIEVGRRCAVAPEGVPRCGLTAWRLRLIDERLEKFGDQPTLAELADLCRMSIRQLTRAFRVSRGCSIGDYVARYWVAHAKRLLVTDLSVKAIGYSVGFASPSAFCCAFRRAVGETPGQFRQRALRGE